MNNAHWLKSREIVERVVIHGDLIMETPVGFGTGNNESLVDIPILLDPLDGQALLTGDSLAGALRSYLRERQHGFGQKGKKDSLYLNLFGNQGDSEGEQSFVIVSDSLGKKPLMELRDGVKIDPCTHTAQHKNKFDFELIEAGTRFPIKIELLLQEDKKDWLVFGLAVALQGLENGEIPLGSRKRRGFGKCRVRKWRVCRYELTKPEGLIGWITNDKKKEVTGIKISDLLNIPIPYLDNRIFFSLNCIFSLNGSILIRSDSDDANAPDSVHQHSNRNNRQIPILTGTGLAGALRARALRIVKTVGRNGNGETFVDKLFGPNIKSSKDKASSSKIVTAETEITDPLNLVQSRITIDRFTGGSFPTALLNEEPVFGKEDTTIQLSMIIQQPSNAEIGLLLLLLKDLWTSDLPLGGESSIGRGRLRGINAELAYKRAHPHGKQYWKIDETDGKLAIIGYRNSLEDFVQDFWREMQG